MRRLEASRRRTLAAIADAYGAQLIDTRSMEWRVEAAVRAGTPSALQRSRGALPVAVPQLREAARVAAYAGAWLAGAVPVATATADVDLATLATDGPEGRWTVGRSSACDVVLRESEQVSRQHCALLLRGGRWYVQDLGSSNGTWVGARRVDAAPLGRLLPLRVADVALRLRGR